MPHVLGTIIAERVLSRRLVDGTVVPVRILVGQPIRTQNDSKELENGACPIQILEMYGDSVRVVYGTDSVQALYLALIFAGKLLEMSPVAKAGELSWADVPHYGFSPDVEIPQM